MAELPRILLVDDVPENLVALEAVLRRDDVVLLSARSGREALELLLVEPVVLAIVDVQMPDMDGFDLAELMRGAERTRQIPIIFVTAGPHDSRWVFRGYESGGVDFLHKPLDDRVLRSKVDVFLQLDRQARLLADQVQELRQAERQLRDADRRKDEFLGLLSHELRNPLGPIRNGLFVLGKADPGSDQAKRARSVIERQVTHLTRIVDDLLDVTRISSGKVQLRLEPVELGEAVRRSAEDYRTSFLRAGLELVVTTSPEPVWSNADPTRVAQALGNLLANALKFTPSGGRVSVRLEPDGGDAVLVVQDTGMGIAPEIVDRVFEPFTQADRTLDRSRGGLGLGLTLVKGLMEAHGGSVTASSPGPGGGTTFAIRLPRSDAPAPKPSEPERNGNGGARRVLLVEDNDDAAESLRDAIMLLGHEVHVGRTGLEGIALARAIKPDVVLCDIGLPGADGYEVARTLRRLVPHALLIAMTGYGMPDDKQRAKEAGFAQHVTKPPRIADLERLLTRR
jgi:signal transduction histidine kinase